MSVDSFFLDCQVSLPGKSFFGDKMNPVDIILYYCNFCLIHSKAIFSWSWPVITVTLKKQIFASVGSVTVTDSV